MRFANLYWDSAESENSSVMSINIGNNLQFMVFDYLYSQVMSISEVVRLQTNELKEYRGENFHDILLKNYETERVNIGDIFVFNNIGVYSITEASYLFLSRDLPQVLVADEKGDIQVVRKAISAAEINMGNREV